MRQAAAVRPATAVELSVSEDPLPRWNTQFSPGRLRPDPIQHAELVALAEVALRQAEVAWLTELAAALDLRFWVDLSPEIAIAIPDVDEPGAWRTLDIPQASEALAGLLAAVGATSTTQQ